jgi:ribosomal protein L7/L12
MEDLDPRLREEILRQVEAGKKIDAIKSLRDATGMGLADAKNLVEALAAGGERTTDGVATDSSRSGALPAKVQGLLHEGQKLDAIKALRSERGLGLKEARIQVEAYLEKHPELAYSTSSGSGKFVTVAVVIVLAIAGWVISQAMLGGSAGR